MDKDSVHESLSIDAIHSFIFMLIYCCDQFGHGSFAKLASDVLVP